MSEGFVYILTNPSMPGLVKIGKTTRDVEQRANELWQTGVPTPFEVARYVFSPDCGQLELWIHARLDDFRAHGSREFFRCEVSRAIHELDDLHFWQLDEWLRQYRPDCTVAHEKFDPVARRMVDVANESGLPIEEIFEAVAAVKAEDLGLFKSRAAEAADCKDGEVANGPH